MSERATTHVHPVPPLPPQDGSVRRAQGSEARTHQRAQPGRGGGHALHRRRRHAVQVRGDGSRQRRRGPLQDSPRPARVRAVPHGRPALRRRRVQHRPGVLQDRAPERQGIRAPTQPLQAHATRDCPIRVQEAAAAQRRAQPRAPHRRARPSTHARIPHVPASPGGCRLSRGCGCRLEGGRTRGGYE